MKQIVERRRGIPDVPYVVSSGERLVIVWVKNLQRKIVEGWRLIDENDRLWDLELGMFSVSLSVELSVVWF